MLSAIYPRSVSMSMSMGVCMAIYGHGAVRSQDTPGRYHMTSLTQAALPRAIGWAALINKESFWPALPASDGIWTTASGADPHMQCTSPAQHNTPATSSQRQS